MSFEDKFVSLFTDLIQTFEMSTWGWWGGQVWGLEEGSDGDSRYVCCC